MDKGREMEMDKGRYRRRSRAADRGERSPNRRKAAAEEEDVPTSMLSELDLASGALQTIFSCALPQRVESDESVLSSTLSSLNRSVTPSRRRKRDRVFRSSESSSNFDAAGGAGMQLTEFRCFNCEVRRHLLRGVTAIHTCIFLDGGSKQLL